MEALSILTGLIIIFCLVLAIINLLLFCVKRKKYRLRNSAVFFGVSIFSLVLLILAEEFVFSYNYEDKVEVLVASREAPIGGILLKLYKDNSYEMGGFREVIESGIFEIKSDTLYFTAKNNPKPNNIQVQKIFLFKKGYLEEVGDTGIGFLKVHVNKLK